MDKLYDQWNTRLGLESIKMKHFIESTNTEDPFCPKRAARHKAEIAAFIGAAEAKEKARGMDDVYITDHTPK